MPTLFTEKQLKEEKPKPPRLTIRDLFCLAGQAVILGLSMGYYFGATLLEKRAGRKTEAVRSKRETL